MEQYLEGTWLPPKERPVTAPGGPAPAAAPAPTPDVPPPNTTAAENEFSAILHQLRTALAEAIAAIATDAGGPGAAPA